jgi:hypothetical protein
VRRFSLFALIASAAVLLGVGAASARTTASCSARGLSASLPAQKIPAKVASVRARIAKAAVACNYQALQRIAYEKDSFSFSFGSEKSPAAYWKQQEARGDRPLARLVKILGLPVTRNEAGAYAWPSAYTEHPTAKDWNALVRAGVYARAAVDRMRKGGNMYFGYRSAITKTGDWQFFVAGD